ncbi:MAG: hypothetical protein NTY61_02075 [Candidatus Parcubacteria bacterium]|nr:hypothetical protein [Candidatus Parcubacteria bacterium]
MYKYSFLLLLFGVVNVAYAISGIQVSHIIDHCYIDFNQSNGLYVLDRDIHAYDGGICLVFRNFGDVTLDCQGHQIIADNPNDELIAINVYSGRNIVIKNCRIKNSFEAIAVDYDVSSIQISNNVLENNYYGILTGNWNNGHVGNVDLISNSVSGNTLPGVSGRGCPMAVYYTQKANFFNNSVCKNMDMSGPCWFGPLVYCASSTIIDKGNNKILSASTNCPINSGACPWSLGAGTSPSVNGINLPPINNKNNRP